MTRFVSSTNETEAAKVSVQLIVLAALDFSTGYVRAHDGIGSYSFGGNTYTGVGQFGGIELVEESTEIVARGVRAKLSGVDASLVSTVMTEVYQGRTATFYLGMIDTTTNAFVADPEEIWSGRMDTMSIEIDKGSAAITLTCEHELRRDPPASRMTNEDQQIRSTGDRFFDMLHLIPTYKASWGEKPQGYRATTGGRTITPAGRNQLR